MGIIAESPTWEPTIYSLETTDPVEGGVTGISNRSRIELTNRTAQIKDVLNKHGIEVDPASAIGFTGQWIDVAPTFEGSVIDSDVVYYNIGNARYEKALADGTTKQHFVGVADVTNNKVIGGGFLGSPVIVGVPVQGSIIYLSDTLPGVMTITASAVAVGKWLFTGTMMLNAGVGGAGGAGGSYLHEQDTYRMLLQDSYYKNAFFDQLLDDIFITHDMEFDFGSNKLEFTAGEQVTSSGNLKDPLVALTIDEAFLSVDIDDSGATVFELSADGGSNWEVTGNNAVHLFSNTGSDLRIRITGGGSGEIRSYGVLYNPDPQLATSIGMLHSEVVDDEPTKHFLEGDIDHSNINDDEPTKHRLINDGGTGVTDLWSASKINSEIGGAVGPASVGQSQLKTSFQEQSAVIGTLSSVQFTLTGGQYIFTPQFKSGSGISIACRFGNTVGGSVYGTTIRMDNPDGFSSVTGYVKQRYVTASGEVNWLHLLRDKASQKIVAISFAVDPPCFGNGGDPEKVPHPYIALENLDDYEIFLVNPTNKQVAEWEAGGSVIDHVMANYDIDDSVEPDWPETPVTVGLPTNAENLPWGTPIEPIKKVIPQPDDVTTALLKLKS